MNLYAYVTNNPIMFVDPLGLASLTEVEEGAMYYTWNLGWVDKSHYGGKEGPEALTNTWNKISDAETGSSLTFEIVQDQAGKVTTGVFTIDNMPENKNDRKEALLFAWVIVSESFENYQKEGPQGLTGLIRSMGDYTNFRSINKDQGCQQRI